MDLRSLVIELSEKIGLIATAGLLSVLIPRLRDRLLGVGRPRDIWLAVAFGVVLSLWGAWMNFWWLDHRLNLRAIGIMIAAILGGVRAGAVAGLLGGAFWELRVVAEPSAWGLLISLSDGVITGWFATHFPSQFVGWRALRTATILQLPGLMIAGIRTGMDEAYGVLLPMAAQIVAAAAGVTLFVNVARVVLAREEQAVALVEARAAADALSLQSLRRRLEPHFLFNALNTLRATIRKDPEEARGLVSNLADLYRYLLRHENTAPLKSELEHAQAYLAIETARLGPGRMQVKTAIAPGLEETPVPALLLQPLVENAVKHGIAPKRGTAQVLISAAIVDAYLEISVEDSCEGSVIAKAQPGTQVALTTLRERLKKQYGERATLGLTPQEHGMKVTARIPLDHESVL